MPIKKDLFTPFFLLLGVATSFAQPAHNSCKKAKQVFDLLTANHVQPPALDDAWSRYTWQEFFNQLDPGKQFLATSDLATFTSYQTTLDDGLRGGECALPNKAAELFIKKLNETSLLIGEYLNAPLDYSKSGQWTMSYHSPQAFETTQATLNAKKKDWLKLEVLFWMERNSDGALSKLDKSSFQSLEASARTAIKVNEQSKISRLLNPAEGMTVFVENALLKAIAHSFDPHSDFFTISQKEDLTTSLSPTGLSFGIDLEQIPSGQIKISRIVPGGPAWQSNELNQGDVITTVAWSNQEPVDITQYSLEDLEEDLEDAGKTEVTLTVKKLDGQLKKVMLKKQELAVEDNIIKSYILKGDKSIGYISLPSFYTVLEDNSNAGCANDVARELIKLKREKIDGLILDLRFNGGGSLYEALGLAGIFIDAGPIALMQQNGQPPITLKDMNRGTIYDGPLVIMVNGFSASASEVVSAVLQDLNRAIIVGKQTYGKASGQIVLPLQENVPQEGFIKVTKDKLYRVTGKSLQKKGVVPDLVLPDVLESFYVSESDYSNALTADSITKKVYYTPLAPLPLKELSMKSAKRIAASPQFASIQEAIKYFSIPSPLKLDAFDEYTKNQLAATEALERTRITNSRYTVQTAAFDRVLNALDDHGNLLKKESLLQIQNSPYVDEAYQILLDYITIKK